MSALILVALMPQIWQLSGLPIQPDPNGENNLLGDHAVGEFGSYFEGDIVLSEEDLGLLSKQGVKRKNRKWPDQTVVYTISPAFNDSQRDIILQGMKLISDKTCIKFKERTSEKSFVRVAMNKQGCFSALGRTGKAQPLNLNADDECIQTGTVAHEFIHALGFLHEQSRTDRDDYVTINKENIIDGYQSQFRKAKPRAISNYGVEYDYNSIMHYPSTAFSKNGKDTITVKQAGAVIGQESDLSEKDVQKINNMYGC